MSIVGESEGKLLSLISEFIQLALQVDSSANESSVHFKCLQKFICTEVKLRKVGLKIFL